jgi:phospholipase C
MPKAGAYLDRCGYGPRIPLWVISPFAKVNFVNHAITDETSVLRFIEDNWNLGRIGDQSLDALAGSLTPMFDFQQNDQDGNSQGGPTPILILNPTTGVPVPGQSVPGQNQNQQ